MSENRPSRWQDQRLRVGAVLGLVLAAGVFAMFWQSPTPSRADAPAHAFHTLAYFPAKDKLQVAIALTNKQEQPLKGTLQIELIGATGKVQQAHQLAIEQKDEVASYRFELPASKEDAGKLKLRTRFGDQTEEIAVSQVLLRKAHETTLAASQEFHVGSSTGLRAVIQGVKSLTETLPIAGADIIVSLRDKDNNSHKLYTGKTGTSGNAVAQFDIPELPEGQYTLEVVTKSQLGEEKLERAVQLRSESKILLVTDKPIYQPGQEIHVRALALRPFDLKPIANKDILFEIEDSKGNKVYKKTLRTSDFGIAAIDFQLADEVNMGGYTIRTQLGQQRADKTVEVKRYVLPKFKVDVTADKKFYLPKETIKGSLQSDYFFGKPVANSKVEVTASTFDVAFKKFTTWNGKTDANGHVKFEIQLPDYFVGTPLQSGNAIVKLDVKVTDTADHAENSVKSYTVSEQPIRVNLVPSGGRIVPEMANRIFAAATYPDGSPATAEVKVWLGKEAKGAPIATLKTNEVGLADFTVTPKGDQLRAGNQQQRNIEMLGGNQVGWGPTILLDMHAQAADKNGSKAQATLELNSQPLGENVMLRLNKAIFQHGDTLDADIVTSAGLPTAYIDIIRGGQVLLTKWLEVKDGKASHRLDIPQNLFGSVEVHAYQMLTSGEIIRDSRVVYIQPRNELKIKVDADKSVYAPGENGRIRFEVTDANGKPTAAALGVIVVDEAVYALQDLQPGLEKVYFTLQEELMKPQVQIKYSVDNINNLVLQPALPPMRQLAAEVLLTAVQPKAPARWEHVPGLNRKQQAATAVMTLGQGVWNYAWNFDDALTVNKATGKVDFAPDLVDKIVKAQQVHVPHLNSPFGERITLDEAKGLAKEFEPNRLAMAITLQRLQQMHHWVGQYAQQAQLLKNGVWTLPENTITEAIKKMHVQARWHKDAWGREFQIVKRAKPAADNNDNPTGMAQFKDYHIVSAGPDGKVGTADDIVWTQKVAQEHQYAWNGMWWGGAAQELHDGIDRPVDQVRLGGRGHPRMFAREELQKARIMPLMQMERAAMNGMPVPMMAPAMPGAMPPVAKMAAGMGGLGDAKDAASGKGQGGGGGDAPITKVRDYFPETLLWQPSLITNDKGIADLAVNFADSITTWRLTASASSRAGALGGVNVPLKVFQDFFVDIDVPVSLTQNDEIAMPVAVYNYLTTPQTVRVELQNEPWFTLLDDGGLVRKLDLKPNEVTAVKFRFKANRVGNHPLTVKAFGSKKSDAVKRVLEVLPDGEKMEKVISDRLNGKMTATINIPQDSVADASKIMVRIYPGVFAQVVEGMDSMLRMPGGCFEQTSSSAYPNVLVVDYIRKNKIATPQVMMKAEQYLNGGYQRLLTFERPGGGFDWWGSGEPLIWLSAYGLQEFADMAKVWPVDKGIIDRTQNFLMNKMDKDGTWSVIGATHGETIERMGNTKLLLTSYVTWSLLESGIDKKRVEKSIDFIRKNIDAPNTNAYILALAANALATYDPKDDSTLEVVRKLDKLQDDVPEWKAICFPSKSTSLSYGRGDGVTIETTALAAMAMLKTGQSTAGVNKALTYLVKTKQNGHWGGTQATILALKALLTGMGGSAQKGVTPFTLHLNGAEVARGEVNEENSDMLQLFDLQAGTKLGANELEIRVKGETGLMYQVVGRHYAPWKKEQPKTVKNVFDVSVAYDRTQLSTHDVIKAKATLKYNDNVPTSMVMLELGIAPGFTVDAGDFAEMVGKKTINKFSVTPSKVTLYLGDIRPGESQSFEYTLKAKYPLRVQTPATTAYEYYTPANRGVARPVELTVTERK